MSGDWPALEGIDWPRAYARTEDYPDEFGEVRVVDPVEAQQRRRSIPILEPDERAVFVDDGARLFANPSDHRRQAVHELLAAVEAALRHVDKARGWAAAVNYHDEVKDKITDAIAALQGAVDLIGVFEE